MLLSGLRGDASAIDDCISWIERSVVEGQREFDVNDVRKAVGDLELQASPAKTLVSVATLVPDRMAEEAAYAIDWVDRFDGADAFEKRRPRFPATWAELQTEIEVIPERLGAASAVGVTGSMRLATAFAVGASMRMVTGTEVSILQRGELWNSSTPYDAPIEPRVVVHELGFGDDIAIAVEVSTPISADVLAFIERAGIRVARLVVLSPASGPKDNAVAGSSDANALAVGIRDAARYHAGLGPQAHLFLAGPAGLALLLGHRWNRVAPKTLIYEDLFTLGYQAAFTISS